MQTLEGIKNQLFKAVYFNDLTTLLKVRHEYPEVYRYCLDFKLTTDENYLDIKIELALLTHLNYRVWNKHDWVNKVMHKVESRQKNTQNMLEFWNAEGIFIDGASLPAYSQYCELFFCLCKDEMDRLDDPAYDFNGEFREIDRQLFISAESFNFQETKTLLLQGANPHFCFDEKDKSHNIFDRISGEASFLAIEVFEKFKHYENKGINKINCEQLTIFSHLIGLAAHEDMWSLINKYKQYSDRIIE